MVPLKLYNIETTVAVQYFFSLVTLCVYDLMAIINLLMVVFPLPENMWPLLWFVVVIDAICILYTIINFAWIRTTNKAYFRRNFDYPVTVLAIIISLGAIFVGSFVIWSETPSLGPYIVQKCLGYIFLSTWWFLAYSTAPPADKSQWNAHFLVLLIMGLFQAVLLIISFVYTTKHESSETISETGVAHYMVSVFENVLLVEIVHMAFEAIVKTFDIEDIEEEQRIYDDEPMFSTEMILMVSMAAMMLVNILLGIICLVLREIYFRYDSQRIATVQIIQISLLVLFSLLLILISIYLALRLSKTGRLYLPITQLLTIIGTIVMILVFIIAFVISDINTYIVTDEKTLLGIFCDLGSFVFFVLWWAIALMWHKYITQHTERFHMWDIILRVLVIATASYIILFVTSNIFHESSLTVEDIPLPMYINSVAQNILLFEFLHLATGTKHFFRKLIPQRLTAYAPISLHNYAMI